MLFSATQTRKTEDLARISLKKEPIYVGVHDTKEIATVEGLEQVNLELCGEMVWNLEKNNLKVTLKITKNALKFAGKTWNFVSLEKWESWIIDVNTS